MVDAFREHGDVVAADVQLLQGVTVPDFIRDLPQLVLVDEELLEVLEVTQLAR